MRLKAISITPKPDENVVVIGGNNGQGKTSILNSIAMALGGSEMIPTQPVRAGEDKASVEVTLDDLKVRRTFSANGSSQLIIEDANGDKVPSPQALLERLTGKLTFDPLAFLRLGKKEQANFLRKLVGIDTTSLDVRRKSLYDERTVVNRELERSKVMLSQLKADPEVVAVDVRDIMKELADAEAKNKEIDTKLFDVSVKQRKMRELEEEKARLILQLEKVQQCIDLTATEIKSINDDVNAAQRIDTAVIREKIAAANETNKRAEANKQHAAQLAVVKDRTEDSQKLTDEITAIDVQKQEMLSGAKFPITGLSFNDDGVTFGGIPFEQSSGAEQLRVSLAIAAAMNPTIRIALIRDGSLLDDQSMVLLHQLANEYDLQVWIEVVGKGDNVSVIIEDGEVALESQIVMAAEQVAAKANEAVAEPEATESKE